MSLETTDTCCATRLTSRPTQKRYIKYPHIRKSGALPSFDVKQRRLTIFIFPLILFFLIHFLLFAHGYLFPMECKSMFGTSQHGRRFSSKNSTKKPQGPSALRFFGVNRLHRRSYSGGRTGNIPPRYRRTDPRCNGRSSAPRRCPRQPRSRKPRTHPPIRYTAPYHRE